jgi:hypothetical protein
MPYPTGGEITFNGMKVPKNCILCGGGLDYEAAEREFGDDVVMAEGHDAAALKQYQADGKDYLDLEADGKAGVVHGSCMENAGWEMS